MAGPDRGHRSAPRGARSHRRHAADAGITRARMGPQRPLSKLTPGCLSRNRPSDSLAANRAFAAIAPGAPSAPPPTRRPAVTRSSRDKRLLGPDTAIRVRVEEPSLIRLLDTPSRAGHPPGTRPRVITSCYAATGCRLPPRRRARRRSPRRHDDRAWRGSVRSTAAHRHLQGVLGMQTPAYCASTDRRSTRRARSFRSRLELSRVAGESGVAVRVLELLGLTVRAEVEKKLQPAPIAVAMGTRCTGDRIAAQPP